MVSITVAVLLSLVACFLWGAFPSPGNGHLAIFGTAGFLALAVALCALCIVCSARRGRWRRPSFLLCHLAVVLVSAGAFVGYRHGERVSFGMQVLAQEDAVDDRLPRSDGTYFTMPFAVGVPEARADYYPPTLYGLYAPPEYGLVREVKVLPDGSLDLPPAVHPSPGELRDEAGDYMAQIVLSDGTMLQMVTPKVRRYEATLRFVHKDSPSDYRTAAVNDPVSYRGWRFYLMDYKTEPWPTVSFSARRDPGRGLVIAGIWLLIVGTAWICWRPGRAGA